MTRVLVTGGAKGVGAAIVRALVADGHDVDFTYRSSGEQAQALAAEITGAAPGRSVRAFALLLCCVSAAVFCCFGANGFELQPLRAASPIATSWTRTVDTRTRKSRGTGAAR